MKKSILGFVILMTLSVWSAIGWSETFTIEEGEVTITAAFCPPDECLSQSGVLRGQFDAEITNDTILFNNILVKSEVPGFQLPEDPDLDSGGTVRDVKFELNNELLHVSGIIDSRAFDGPLIEYTFTASTTASPQGFDADGFYNARQDFRRCASPMCGGIFVKPVNRRMMRCPDGTRGKECYIGTVNWPDFGGSVFNGNETLLLQGDITQTDDLLGQFGAFSVKGAYRAALEGKKRGRYMGVVNNGIVCITSPCFSYDEHILNRDRKIAISRVNLEASGADEKTIAAAFEILGSGEALISQGFNRRVKEFAGIGKEFVATQLYLPIKPKRPIRLCPTGYTETDMGCATRHGCFFPQIELIATGGALMIDPETGEELVNITYSCVDECEFPAEPLSNGYCQIFLP